MDISKWPDLVEDKFDRFYTGLYGGGTLYGADSGGGDGFGSGIHASWNGRGYGVVHGAGNTGCAPNMNGTGFGCYVGQGTVDRNGISNEY